MPARSGVARTKIAVRNIGRSRDLLVEAQTGARRIGFGRDLDLGHPELDEPAQLIDPLGHVGGAGERSPASKTASALSLVMAVEIAADQEEGCAAFDRIR